MIGHTSDTQDRLGAQFAATGVAVVEYALTAADLACMETAFPDLGARTAGAHAEAFSSAARDWLACHEGLLTLAARYLGTDARLSRLQAFDNSPDSNWFVPWHQDRAENGIERTIEQLERAVALRIHLDDCDETNGPLEVLPGTHTRGRLTAADISDVAANMRSLVCLAARGDVVALRPLLVHRSQRAQRPAARRVIHIEFTACDPAPRERLQ